jgi:hypothetical protein
MIGKGVRSEAVIESMSGARFVHDQLEPAGWDVRIADAVKARGIALRPLSVDKDMQGPLEDLTALEPADAAAIERDELHSATPHTAAAVSA